MRGASWDLFLQMLSVESYIIEEIHPELCGLFEECVLRCATLCCAAGIDAVLKRISCCDRDVSLSLCECQRACTYIG